MRTWRIRDNYSGFLKRRIDNVTIFATSYYYINNSKKKKKESKDVWIGRNVCIVPGVSIGEGTVIGANAVVTHNIPDCCIAAGVPAKVIKYMDR